MTSSPIVNRHSDHRQGIFPREMHRGKFNKTVNGTSQLRQFVARAINSARLRKTLTRLNPVVRRRR